MEHHENQSDTYVTPTQKTLLKGYNECRSFVRENCAEFKWAFSNLSGEKRNAIWCLLDYAGRCYQLLGLDQGSDEAEKIQKGWREENEDWFNGKYRSPRLVSLLDSMTKFDVDQRYLVQMLEAVEQWLSQREFATVADFDRFANNLGGSMVNALLQIVECEPGADPEHINHCANQIGKSIAIAQILSRFRTNLKRGRVFLPQDMIQQSGCRISDLCMGRGGPAFDKLIAGIVKDSESELLQGAELLGDVSFDGQRVLKSLLSLTMRLLEKIKSDPSAILQGPVELTTGEQFKFQLRHILGIEGKPYFTNVATAHH